MRNDETLDHVSDPLDVLIEQSEANRTRLPDAPVVHVFQSNRRLVRVVRPDGSRETLVINDASDAA